MEKPMRLRRMIAANVAALRKERGYSQEALARLLSVNKQTIWRIEAGLANTTTDTIEQLGRVFDVDPALLLLPHQGKNQVHKFEDDIKNLDKVLCCLTETTKLARAYRIKLHIRRGTAKPA